ncbi:hypothetical protein NPIL_578681 [Nephila pilipes]|uniref:Uncharacterized protein n=1 Tax=Nephila pilipes TaxID=299642 RepID=A0A8X6QC74_NEPPI|nr:hypothetical protein NPIL_578681 [Nephila pilipes]
MDTDTESITEQEMISSANSYRASTLTPREDLHSSCILWKQIEKELKTYTDSIDYCQTLIWNLERQGLFDHPIYTTQCAMTQGFMKQREQLTAVCARKETTLKHQVDEFCGLLYLRNFISNSKMIDL